MTQHLQLAIRGDSTKSEQKIYKTNVKFNILWTKKIHFKDIKEKKNLRVLGHVAQKIDNLLEEGTVDIPI